MPGATPRLVQIRLPVRQEWVPSRYNARTVHPDGRLILWNTYTGAISVFTPEQRAPIDIALSSNNTVTLRIEQTGQRRNWWSCHELSVWAR